MSETRALNAALSGPVFHGAAARSALHASERHVDRWAPEGPKATRSAAMRSLSFADRVAAPWMSAAMESRGARMMAQPTSDRATPGVSWVFPRPWFQDELDWMASARVRAEQQSQFLTTRGTYESARTSAGDVAMPMVAPEMVAPSMGGHSMSMAMSTAMPSGFASPAAASDRGYGQVHHGLRAYSPMVPFAAAAAAEVVAGAIGLAQQSGLTAVAGAAERSPILGALTMVAPATITPTRAAMTAPTMTAPTMTAPTPSYTVPAHTPAATRAMIDAARAAVSRVDEVRATPAVAPESPAADAPVVSAPPVVAGEAPAPSIAPSASELAIADAASTSPSIAHALRTVDLLLSASTNATAGEPARAPTFEPIVGPRVTMPAGLGGLVTALDAQHTTTHPMARYAGMPAAAPQPYQPAAIAASARAAEARSLPPEARGSRPEAAAPPVTREVPGFSPIWAAPATALGSIASERARAVDHVAWSDRWLARFVGASPVALAALDVAQDRASGVTGDVRARDIASPEMTYLRPPMPAAALAAAIRGSSEIRPLDVVAPTAGPAAPATRPAASPDRALRIDDNEAVSDDIFAAIAAAAVAPPRARPAVVAPGAHAEAAAPPEPRTLTPADVVRAGSRPTIADLVAIAPPPAPGAGLSPGLASSPMAPAMAAMLPMPAAPVFDTRALYPETLGTAYLGGMLSRSAAPIGVVSSAPTMSALVTAAGAMFSAAGFPMAAAAAGAPGSLPYVGFSPAATAMAEARTWATRDLAIAPSSLRLADAAPERVVLAADQMRRAAGPIADATFGSDVMTAPGRVAARTDRPAAPVDLATPSRADEAPTTTAAPPPAMPLETDLVALRAALLAAPDATSLPLAFAEYLPMLSAAMAPPISAAAVEAATTLPSAAAAAAQTMSLPFVTTTAAQSAQAVPAGARGLALPAVGGIPTMASPVASRFAIDLDEPRDVATPGIAGARDSLSSLVAMQAPVAATSTGRPGSLAEMALAWSVAEERAVTDLSFDFVQPEMVLAAKVYGLSPGAAAHAARLAVAGPSAIASLAQSVDLTFLRGFQQLQAQQATQHGATAAPFARAAATAAGDASAATPEPPAFAADASVATSAAQPFAAASPTAAPFAGEPDAAYGAAPLPGLAGSVLSSPRLPRGAFLWPEATVAALGMKAMSPDGVAGMPVVALELLAAAAVADLGTWVTAFPNADQSMIANVIRGMGGTVPTTATTPGPMSSLALQHAPSMTTLAPGAMPSLAAAPAGSPTAAATSTAADDSPDAAMPEIGAAPPDIRARFEAIYVALARTGDGQNLSPSARAARAMALLAREDGGATSPRERALAAWSMLPQVYQGGFDVVAPRDGGATDDAMPAETRPGLAGLAARAGDSLGSFVTPSAREVSSFRGDDARTSALADRVDMPVYVNTAVESPAAQQQQQSIARALARPGRTFAQTGGGEPEIPSWFEDAARRMLDQRTPGAGMSLAELVLVTTSATPSKAIAAATRGASSSAAASTPAVQGTHAAGQKPDVDKLAFDVYLEVLRLIDIARERGGDPYQ